MEQLTQSQSENVSYPIKKWNWGAFSLNWFWGIFNLEGKEFIISVIFGIIFLLDRYTYLNFPKIIGYFLGAASLVFAVYLGIQGNELAWKKAQATNTDYKKFKLIQLIWAIFGYFYLLIIAMGLFLIYILSMEHTS